MRSYAAIVPAVPPASGVAMGSGDFIKGFVATACIAAFQDRAGPLSGSDLKGVARRALQGGTALAAGTQVAASLRQQDYARALIAGAAGAAGVLLIERLLHDAAPSDKEKNHG